VQAIGQIAITYLPVMNTIFETAPLGGDVWLRVLAIAVAAGLVVAVDKRLRRVREAGGAEQADRAAAGT
jgi:cation-transporting ATPase F